MSPTEPARADTEEHPRRPHHHHHHGKAHGGPRPFLAGAFSPQSHPNPDALAAMGPDPPTHLFVQPDRHVRGGRHGAPDGGHVWWVMKLALGGVPVGGFGGGWGWACQTRGQLGPAAASSARAGGRPTCHPTDSLPPRRGNCVGPRGPQRRRRALRLMWHVSRVPPFHFVGGPGRGHHAFCCLPLALGGGGEHTGAGGVPVRPRPPRYSLASARLHVVLALRLARPLRIDHLLAPCGCGKAKDRVSGAGLPSCAPGKPPHIYGGTPPLNPVSQRPPPTPVPVATANLGTHQARHCTTQSRQGGQCPPWTRPSPRRPPSGACVEWKGGQSGW